MNLQRSLRSAARPLRRILPKQPKLYHDDSFLAYVARKRAGLLQRAGDIKVLALRASTTDYAFNPDVEDQAYNLGLTSSDLYSSYVLYKNLKETIVNLRDIVVFVSPSAPGYCLSRTRERYRCIAYRYFFDIPILDEELFESKRVSRIENVCRGMASPAPPANYSGYDRKTYYGINISAKDRVRTHLRENQREPDQMLWLQRLLDEATLANHKVNIVIPPFRSDYKNELARFIGREDVFRKYYALNLEGHRILDYYSSPDFGDECLGDTDHLNEEGARRFTREIMKRISGDVA